MGGIIRCHLGRSDHNSLFRLEVINLQNFSDCPQQTLCDIHTMWFARPRKNCPSLCVGFPSLSKSRPHFWSTVESSTVEYVRPAAGRVGRERSEKRTPDGLSRGLLGGDRAGSMGDCDATLTGLDG